MSFVKDLILPKIIFQTESPMNGKIRVEEKGKSRKLYAGNTLQSVNPDSPLAAKMCWGKIVNIIEQHHGELKNVLLLGLGGGTIPHLLARKYPGVNIVSVDIDPIMVDVARKYMNIDSIPNHRIIIDDACRVVASPEEFGLSPQEFDVTIINTFLGEDYPVLASAGGFFGGIKKVTRVEGMALFNRIYLKHHQDDVNTFIEKISENFSNVKSVIIAGFTNSDNVVIYGFV